MARTPLVVLSLLVLLTGGCVSDQGGASSGRNEATSTPTPSRYDVDPDKPKRVCESTMEGNEPKTICY